jgi:hypothetical protein
MLPRQSVMIRVGKNFILFPGLHKSCNVPTKFGPDVDRNAETSMFQSIIETRPATQHRSKFIDNKLKG